MNPVEELLAAVRSGQAGDLLPPVVARTPDGLVRVSRSLHGDRDAAALGELLARPALSTLAETIATLSSACVSLAEEYSPVLAPDILTWTNGELFGPLIQGVFVAGLAGSPVTLRYAADRRTDDFLGFLTEFLDRLRTDRPGFATGLTAYPGETHNGGRRVLRVDFADGRRLAYKPRPTGTEEAFLAEGHSVFALLNSLPPTSGRVRFPTMWIRSGDGYGWHEWIEPPGCWGPISERLTGARLDPRQAESFWHRAGSLAAVCFGFGLTDLSEGNLLVGERPSEPESLYYPVDLEIAFAGVRRLSETGLIPGPDAQHHHVGLEASLRACAAEGPGACLMEPSPGELTLWHRDVPLARDSTRTVVTDTAGRVGYPAYLTKFLRGMFDAWTLVCSNVPSLRGLLNQPVTTRVLLRSTAEYGDLLDAHLFDGASLPGDAEEIEQLRRFDVPYFFRSSGRGPLQYWDPEHGTAIPFGADLPPMDWAEGLTLARLGVAVLDAVTEAGVTGCTLDDEAKVRLAVGADGGEVAFDWEQVGRRVCYRWKGNKLSVRLHSLTELDAVAERLLRLDAIDASWRARWVGSRFEDDEAAEKLLRLTGAAADWLREVIADHGWPDQLLVGAEASEAACRLVQHLDGRLDFQHSCLTLLTEAVAVGKVPARHLAYSTDAIRVAEDRPQVYGTKFVPVDGRLEPWPIQEPAAVDARRAALGLEPLDEHTATIRQRFPLEAS